MQHLRTQMDYQNGRDAHPLPESEMLESNQMECEATEAEYIYGLKEGEAGQIFYVGRTNNLSRRHKEHRTRFKECKELILEILEVVRDGTGWTRERHYIHVHAASADLLNVKWMPCKPSPDNPKRIDIPAWQCVCERCGYEWTTTMPDKPKVCGRCKSMNWNVKRKEER